MLAERHCCCFFVAVSHTTGVFATGWVLPTVPGTFDWLDSFLEQNPKYTELSERRSWLFHPTGFRNHFGICLMMVYFDLSWPIYLWYCRFSPCWPSFYRSKICIAMYRCIRAWVAFYKVVPHGYVKGFEPSLLPIKLSVSFQNQNLKPFQLIHNYCSQTMTPDHGHTSSYPTPWKPVVQNVCLSIFFVFLQKSTTSFKNCASSFNTHWYSRFFFVTSLQENHGMGCGKRLDAPQVGPQCHLATMGKCEKPNPFWTVSYMFKGTLGRKGFNKNTE